MLNLAFKDLLIQKKSFFFALLYIVFFMFVFQSLQQAMLPAAITAFTYILVMGAFALDDKNKADIMLNSLPVRRSMVVTSKYLSVYLFALIGIVAYMILHYIARLAKVSLDIYPVDLSGILSTFVSISIMNAIFFPLLFKLGYTKAKVINLFLFFVFFFGVPELINTAVSGMEGEWQGGLVTFLKTTPDYMITLLLIIGTLLILSVSWLLSMKLYSKRDF